ncbi:hypothetical protein [Paenibacillus sp. 481]|uniref:hypothetical protein n=1 Tax=Paenibacillus sp. 481 TaxID=2835869 RepID=UPI001E47E9E0|nr:hypothetical protein [Paenibacillus sp. 481]UHA72761.1 hypothetical protein KIK04_19335 [Paenibacillus sp. 481]
MTRNRKRNNHSNRNTKEIVLDVLGYAGDFMKLIYRGIKMIFRGIKMIFRFFGKLLNLFD